MTTKAKKGHKIK